MLEASHFVDVNSLEDDENNHDWAHAELVLHLLVHHQSSLLVAISHEESHENLTLLLCHHVDKEEVGEATKRFSSHELGTFSFLPSDGFLANTSKDEKTKGHSNGQHTNVLKVIIEFELVREHVWLVITLWHWKLLVPPW